MSQKLIETVVNEITTTNSISRSQMSLQGEDNITIAFKRGSGSTKADNQIWVAVSNDGGKSFIEQEISFPGYVTQSNVKSISTESCILVFYDMKDENNKYWDVTARSFDNGKTFSFDTTSLYRSYLISDGKDRVYSHNDDDLYVSEDNCSSWVKLEAFPPVNADEYKVKVSENYILTAAYNYSRDTLFLHYSDDSGQTFKKLDDLYCDMPGNTSFAIAMDEGKYTLTYVHEEVGTYTLKYRNYTNVGLESEGIIVSKTSSMNGDMNAYRWGDTIATSEDGYWDELHLSNNGGGDWKGIYDINARNHHFLNGIFYSVSTETKTGSIKNIVFEKYRLSSKPYFLTPVAQDTVCGTYASGYYYLTLTGASQWVSDSLSFQFQVSDDTTFENILIDTTEFEEDNSSKSSYGIYTYYEDLKGNGSKYYYRVRIFKGEDTTAWSNYQSFQFGQTSITSLNELTNSGISFKQVENSLNLSFANPKEFKNSSISIFNVSGKKIIEKRVNNLDKVSTLKMNTEFLSSGAYLIKVENRDGKASLAQRFSILK